MPRTKALTTPSWKYYDLLHVLGTAEEICGLLKAKGYQPPPQDTVQGWRNRNSIPGRWVPVFIKIGIERGFLRSVDDLAPAPLSPSMLSNKRKKPHAKMPADIG